MRRRYNESKVGLKPVDVRARYTSIQRRGEQREILFIRGKESGREIRASFMAKSMERKERLILRNVISMSSHNGPDNDVL